MVEKPGTRDAARQLAEAEARFRTLVEQLPAITYVGAPGDAFASTYISPQIETILGYTPEEWQADPTFWIERVHPDDRARLLASDARAMQAGVAFQIEYRFVARDGRTVWVQEDSRPVCDAAGQPRFWQGVISDITARKEAEERLRREELRYRSLVERIPAVTYITQLAAPGSTEGSGAVSYISGQVEALLGYTPEEWRSAPGLWAACIHPDDRERVLADNARANATGVSSCAEYRLISRDGQTRWVRDDTTLVRAADGEPLFWQGFVFDITALREAEAATRAAEEQFRTLVEHIPAATYEVLDTARVTYMSPQIERLTGYAPAVWTGADDFWLAIIHPADREVVIREAARTDASGEPYRMEHRYITRDGGIVWVRNEAALVRRAADGTQHWQGVITDITERKRLEEQLRRQAFHDTLTGLANRALLHDRMGQSLAHARRHGADVGVLFLDLDNFKIVNDSLGHAAGDALLTQVAGRLRGCVREGDTVARLGGDEFAILLDDAADVSGGVELAERVLAGLRAPFRLGDRAVVVTASVGVALSRSGADQPDDLLRHADIAMYRAKSSGRNRFAVFEPEMHAAALERLDREHDLRVAVEREQFVLCYQPTVALDTGRVLGVEALARWRHPERGLVPPSEFIALAEETGLIVPLGRWAVREACRRATIWNTGRARAEQIGVSVNLSARQFQDAALVADIEDALRNARLRPALLTLEITETVAMEDAATAIRTMTALRALGVSLSIDDFGAGYSSLAYLKRFPIGALKLDRSFVAALGADPEDGAAVVAATIALARALGLDVVATEVETVAQRDELWRLGCRAAQGYLFAPPTADGAIDALLDALRDAAVVLAGA